MHDEFTDRLSDYLDDELSTDERIAVESHLAVCPECAATLSELRHLVERARTIGPRPPRADLWPGIAGRIAAARTREPRRFSFTMTQLAAAAVVLVAISSAVAWQIAGRSAPMSGDVNRSPLAASPIPQRDVAIPLRDSSADVSARPVSLADAQYDAAVADLERALAKGRGRLDKATIAVVEENLSIIDQAIAQARDALVSDPANTYLSGHLVEARRRKLDLLRRATALTETN
jgi:anti-sigma factor RsiW